MTSPSTMAHLRRLQGVELLRFLFCGVVVLYHYLFLGPAVGELAMQPIGRTWLQFGRFGVTGFFIISGFVISMSASKRNWWQFTISRARRLYPSILICATITLLVSCAFNGSIMPALAPFLKAASFAGLVVGGTMVDPSYWSIVFELRFYAIAAILLYFFAFHLMPWIVSAACLVGFGLFLIGVPERLLEFILFPHAPFFLIGIALHSIHQGELKKSACFLALGVAFGGFSAFHNFEFIDMLDGHRVGMWVGYAVTLACTGLVALAIFAFPTIKENGAIRVLGGTSYQIYLLHQLVGFLALKVLLTAGWSPAISISSVVVLIFALSLVVYAIEGFVWNAVLAIAGRVVGRSIRYHAESAIRSESSS